MGVRLYLDHVGIEARAAAIVGAQPVVVERITGQAGNIPTSRVADVQVLVGLHVSDKRAARGHI